MNASANLKVGVKIIAGFLVALSLMVGIHSTDEMGQTAQAVSTIIARLQDVGHAFGVMSNNLRRAVSAVVEENTAATEEMSAQVEEVTASAQLLAEMPQQLQAVVAQFKLAQTSASARPAVLRPPPAHVVGHGRHNGHAPEALHEAMPVAQ